MRERERLKAEAQAESGGLGPAQRTSSDPAVNSLKVKKGQSIHTHTNTNKIECGCIKNFEQLLSV